MHDLGVLRDLAIIAGLALPVVALAHRFHLPPLVGFLVVGVLIGPSGAALIPDPETVAALSEIGVVLLLFEIGLELSLSNVLRWGRSVLVAGGAQVAGMLALAAAAGTALDLPIGQALFYGALAAMSSTAAVTKLYADRGELDTPHGRETVSVLLFQDLCIVPLMALLPLLAASGAGPGLPAFWTQLLLSLGAMAALVVGGRLAVRWTLDRVVAQRHRDLFTLCVGFFAIGTALVSAAAGFSLAIGAFLAGLIISESEYGQQALSDVIPFRVLFSGVFFTSIGMLLDVSLLVQRPLLVVGAALLIVAVKTVVATGAIVLRGRPLDTALRSGLGLAQVGEFSFVLAAAGLPLGLFAGNDYQTFLSVAALSLMATPFLIGSARGVAEAVATRLAGAARGAPGGRVEHEDDSAAAGYRDHAVVIGYGLAGRYLARMLRAAGIRCAVIDQNLELVHQARTDGLPAVYGDGTRHALLERVASAHARIIVFAIPSSMEERRGVAAARELAPAARIVVRTRYVRAIDELRGSAPTPWWSRSSRRRWSCSSAPSRATRFPPAASRTSWTRCAASTTGCSAAPRLPISPSMRSSISASTTRWSWLRSRPARRRSARTRGRSTCGGEPPRFRWQWSAMACRSTGATTRSATPRGIPRSSWVTEMPSMQRRPCSAPALTDRCRLRAAPGHLQLGAPSAPPLSSPTRRASAASRS